MSETITMGDVTQAYEEMMIEYMKYCEVTERLEKLFED